MWNCVFKMVRDLADSESRGLRQVIMFFAASAQVKYSVFIEPRRRITDS